MSIPATPLDLVSTIMETSSRPLDGAMICRLRDDVSLEALERGALSARHRYPLSACVLRDRAWHPRFDRAPPIEVVEVEDERARHDRICEALARGFDLSSRPAVRQLLVRGDGFSELVTLGHHAAADVVSGLLWVSHQLQVASGRLPAVETEMPMAIPAMRRHPAPARKSAYAPPGRSTDLWRRENEPSRSRRFASVTFDPSSLQSELQEQGFSYNDLLCAVLLDVFHAWNAGRGASTRRLALWMGINIRSRPFSGYGNASSRVRVYPTKGPQSRLQERCLEIREQVRWSKKHGEWAVPEDVALFRLPEPLMRAAVRAYLGRPWVDMASGTFSHVERLSDRDDEEVFAEVERFEFIGALHRRYPFGVVAMSFRGETTLTFTYDPALLTDDDVSELVGMTRERLDDAVRTLTTG